VSPTLISGAPLLVSLLFSAAIYIVWRRRPQAAHARVWSAAFALIALGWLVVIVTAVAARAAPVPGAAPSLCWLAAALLFVHGLRQRAHRSDMGVVLAAIWAAIGFANAVLFDMVRFGDPLLPAYVPMLTAIGLMLAAVAVGPRWRKNSYLNWCATGLLTCIAIANIVLLWLLLNFGASPTLAMTVPLVATLTYVALGLAAMLLLTEDLAIALERIARTDPLTGVWNRRGFDEAAPHLLDRLRRGSGPFVAAVAIADIDSFKSINDRYGHTTGDEVLVAFAQLLRNAAESGDLVARLGGEEFVLLAVGVDGAALHERVELVRQTVGMLGGIKGELPAVTVSFGVAEVAPGTLALRDALERADHALYRAKETGRNRSVLDGAEDRF